MNLRPRYSLLTLLILTALVAGGVKLWRGPHRVSVGKTPTAFEQDLIKKGESIGLTMTEGRYEYDYVNEWREPRILCVCWYPATPDYLITMSTPDHYPGRKYLYSAATYRKYPFETALAPSAKDRVHCWIKSGRDPVYREIQTQPPSVSYRIGNKPPIYEIVSGEELLQSYLVSEKGKIYASGNERGKISLTGKTPITLAGRSESGDHFNEVQLDEVIDPDVRARVEEELTKVSSKP